MERARAFSIGVHGSRIVLLVVLLVGAFAGLCTGDQYQWIPLSVSGEASDTIAKLPFLVTYCSLADEDFIELWVVRNLQIAATPAPDLCELIVSGERLYRSDRAFSSDKFPVSEDQWTFHESEGDNWFTMGVDLAYVYIYVGGGSFRCLAQVLGLPCIVEVETIRLPGQVLSEVATRFGARRQTSLCPFSAFDRCLRPSR
jgi:hypothetical protein